MVAPCICDRVENPAREEQLVKAQTTPGWQTFWPEGEEKQTSFGNFIAEGEDLVSGHQEMWQNVAGSDVLTGFFPAFLHLYEMCVSSTHIYGPVIDYGVRLAYISSRQSRVPKDQMLGGPTLSKQQ